MKILKCADRHVELTKGLELLSCRSLNRLFTAGFIWETWYSINVMSQGASLDVYAQRICIPVPKMETEAIHRF